MKESLRQRFLRCLEDLNYSLMAERVGFEPTKELPLRWFSRPVLSTAQPPLQIVVLLEL